jgi:hypothetical protein
MNWLLLLKAIAIVESGCDPDAVNMREKAWGLYQMRPAALRDANEVAGTNFKQRDLKKPQVATSMLRAYCYRYLGNDPTISEVLDLWNGGPSGKAGVDYKERVMNLYEDMTTNKTRCTCNQYGGHLDSCPAKESER